MSQAEPVRIADERVLRAAFFVLAVIAQLLLPAVTMRAQAFADDLCVAQAEGSGGDGRAHAHDQQQCAHCRLHGCSSLTPPSAADVILTPAGAWSSSFIAFAPYTKTAWRAQPPPTGPPVS